MAQETDVLSMRSLEPVRKIDDIYKNAFDEASRIVAAVGDETRAALAQVLPEALQATPYTLARRMVTEGIAQSVVDAQISYGFSGDHDPLLPFAIACEPFTITRSEAVELESNGQLYKEFLEGTKALYEAGEREGSEYAWVRETIEVGKSPEIVKMWRDEQRQPVAPFFRPDITVGEDGTPKTVELVQMIGGWGMLTAVTEAYAKVIPPDVMRIVGDSPVGHYLDMVRSQAEKSFKLNKIAVVTDGSTALPAPLAETIERTKTKKEATDTAPEESSVEFVQVTDQDITQDEKGYYLKETGEPLACVQLTNTNQEASHEVKPHTFVARAGFLKSIRPKGEGKESMAAYAKSLRGKTGEHAAKDLENFPIAIVVSPELSAYKRELSHFAKSCREQGGHVYCVSSNEIGPIGEGQLALVDGTPIKGVHRFFQTYNLTDHERSIIDNAAVVYPRSNSFLEEKSTLALLFDPRAEKFWTGRMGPEKFRKMKEMFAETHLVDAAEPLRMKGEEVDWAQLLLMDRKERLQQMPVVIKVSGADGKIKGKSDSWGARGVCTPLEDDATYRTFVVKALKASSPEKAMGIVLQAVRETPNPKVQIELLSAVCNNFPQEKGPELDAAIQVIGQILTIHGKHTQAHELGTLAADLKQKLKGKYPDAIQQQMTKILHDVTVSVDATAQEIKTVQDNQSFSQWAYDQLVAVGLEVPERNRRRLHVAQEFVKSRLFWVWHLDPGKASKLEEHKSEDPRRVRVARFHARVNPFYINVGGEKIKLAGMGITFSQTANQKSHLSREAILAPAAVPPTNF